MRYTKTRTLKRTAERVAGAGLWRSRRKLFGNHNSVFSSRFDDFDPEEEGVLAQELKLAALDGIESEWRAEHDTSLKTGSYYPSYSSWMSYGTSFIGTIIENLQIQVKDVHIRYEDDISWPERPFSCGFCLESLAAQSCDENGTPRFVHRDPDQKMAFKIVELNNMAAYLNMDDEMLGDLPISELTVRLMCDESTVK